MLAAWTKVTDGNLLHRSESYKLTSEELISRRLDRVGVQKPL
jgi:hypothetical protein